MMKKNIIVYYPRNYQKRLRIRLESMERIKNLNLQKTINQAPSFISTNKSRK